MENIYEGDEIIDIAESDKVTEEPSVGGLELAAKIDNLADGITLRMQEDPSEQELVDSGTSVTLPDAGWSVKFPKLGLALGIGGGITTIVIILIVIFVVMK
jgi:hypothetical protein